jgi:hypothetical protein
VVSGGLRRERAGGVAATICLIGSLGREGKALVLLLPGKKGLGDKDLQFNCAFLLSILPRETQHRCVNVLVRNAVASVVAMTSIVPVPNCAYRVSVIPTALKTFYTLLLLEQWQIEIV